MQKDVLYVNTKFPQELIQKGTQKIKSFNPSKDQSKNKLSLSVDYENVSWKHDTEAEFFADYSKSNVSLATYLLSLNYNEYKLEIYFINTKTIVQVTAKERAQIEEVHQIFSQNSEKYLLPKKVIEKVIEEPTIFLGHGRNPQWKELKEHLQDKHNYKIEAYEIGARAGHSIRDILEEMLRKSSMAFIVMTAEDENIDGTFHARENVIHELGLFQARLGFHRAIAVLEEGAQEFSNIQGIQQLRFSRGNIKEIFGDVVATLNREYY